MTKKLLILCVLAFSIFNLIGCSGSSDEGGTVVAPKPDNTGKSAEKGQQTALPNAN